MNRLAQTLAGFHGQTQINFNYNFYISFTTPNSNALFNCNEANIVFSKAKILLNICQERNTVNLLTDIRLKPWVVSTTAGTFSITLLKRRLFVVFFAFHRFFCAVSTIRIKVNFFRSMFRQNYFFVIK